jgi:hypothetical protein
MALDDDTAPPAGEEIHLPGPSLLPLGVAVGLTVLLVGLTTTIILVIAGGVLLLFCILKWIADVRREVDSLPLEH